MSLSSKVKKVTLWKVAIPSMVMILIGTISAPINTFISSGINKTSVEAIGTAGGLLMLFGVLMSLLSGGAGIIISQYIGKKSSNEDLKKATDSTFVVAITQGIILSGILLALAPTLLKAWGLEDGTQQMRDAKTYMYWLAPTYVLLSMNGYFLTTTSVYGNPSVTTKIGITQVITDITLSYLFVHFAGMGVHGVIVGTLVARFMVFILAGTAYHHKVQPVWTIKKFDWKVTKKIMGVSIPIAGERINFNVGTFVRGIIIGIVSSQIGLVYHDHNFMIWSRAIFGSMQSITLVASVAFSIAVESVVARLLGKGDFEEAKKTVVKAYMYALMIDLPLVLLVFLCQTYIIDLITTSEPNKQDVADLKGQLRWTFLVLAILEVGRATNLVYIAATRSAGDSKYTAYISVPVTWIFGVVLAWVLSRYAYMGFLGIVVAMAADECARGIINYARWKSGKWKTHLKKLHT